MPTLQVVITSTRPTRIGAAIGDWFVSRAKDHGAFDVEVTDLEELGLPFLDEPEAASTGSYSNAHTKQWSATIQRSDAVVFVLPEYNYSFPATVKNAIDFLYHEWAYRPAAICSYGNTSGGLRSTQALKPVLSTVKLFAIPEQVTVQFAPSLVADGDFAAGENHEAAARGVLDELAFLAPHFARIRSVRPS